MEVSAEVRKVIKFAIYSIVLFPSGGGVDDVLVRLSLIKQIVKDITLMRIAFSVRHSQMFWKL